MSARPETILAWIENEQLRKAAGECLAVAEKFNAVKAEIERSDTPIRRRGANEHWQNYWRMNPLRPFAGRKHRSRR